MAGLTDTIGKLAALRGVVPSRGHGAQQDRLRDLEGVDGDPGALRARCHVPQGLQAGAPLVVVLHGCTQDAAAYDHGSGWSTLADRHGFAVLFPEQRRRNNPNLCFNWFVPGDVARDRGEAMSIRRMIARMVALHAIDPARIFVTGLSAGGAMAAALLAVYPDIFAGGAIIAGLPHGVAGSVGEALERMGGRGLPGGADLAARLPRPAEVGAEWPLLSVWQGDADRTVATANADAIVTQWRVAQGLPAAPTSIETLPGGHEHRTWADATGATRIEAYRIRGMGHGTPIDAADGIGAAGAHMLDVGLSSTALIAAGWGLTAGVAAPAMVARPAPRQAARQAAPAPPPATSVTGIIENALRAAGLMR